MCERVIPSLFDARRLTATDLVAAAKKPVYGWLNDCEAVLPSQVEDGDHGRALAAINELAERYKKAVAILDGVVEAEQRDRRDGAYFVPGDSFLGIHLGLVVMEFLDKARMK